MAKSQTRNTGLIDVLASMMQQNMQQAPMQPMMYADATAAARPATFGGTGLADSAADIKKLFPTWQSLSMDAKINGQPFPTFREWLIMQGGNATAMPR